MTTHNAQNKNIVPFYTFYKMDSDENITVAVEDDNTFGISSNDMVYDDACTAAVSPILSIPRLVFVVPYRDREAEKANFLVKMQNLLSDIETTTYCILFIEQPNDGRGFNRGAMKNIGYIMVRHYWPDDYKNITLVFNDIDTLPKSKGLVDYDTVVGRIKHFYGFSFTLGGIVSIKAGDFERLNGFPNYWAWGYEDNMLNIRAKKAGLIIDRSQFYPIHDPRIEQGQSGVYRTVNRGEFQRFYRNIPEGINTLFNISHTTETIDDTASIIHITHFDTAYAEDISKRYMFDIRKSAIPFFGGHAEKRNAKMGMLF